MLPGFAKNLLAAVKTIETTVSSFQAKVKSVEKDLWREYQSLESHLDMRTKKLERLEAVVRNNLALGNGGGDSSSRTARLEEAYRQLKVENHTLRAAAEARAARAGYSNAGGDPQSSPGGSPSPSIPTGPNAKSKDGSSSRASRIPKSGSRGALRTATMSSATSSQQSRNLLELESGPTEQEASSSQRPATSVSSSGGGGGIGGNVMDSKWMLRLRDLEYKLKAEREGRLLDRGEAMKRITASESENVALREGLEREKRRGRAEGSEGRGR